MKRGCVTLHWNYNATYCKKVRATYTANNAENSFCATQWIIISWVHKCNCIITETSKKRTILRYLYSPPGRTERQRPAYNGIWNAIVCMSYRQHPIMAEEKRGQESGRNDWALQKQCSCSSRRSRGITDLGENLRGEGKAPLERLPLSPWVVSLKHISNVLSHRIANPRSDIRQTELSVACYRC